LFIAVCGGSLITKGLTPYLRMNFPSYILFGVLCGSILLGTIILVISKYSMKKQHVLGKNAFIEILRIMGPTIKEMCC